jgi:hypothetical protein
MRDKIIEIILAITIIVALYFAVVCFCDFVEGFNRVYISQYTLFENGYTISVYEEMR